MSEFLERISTLGPKRLALLALELQEQLDALKGRERSPIAIIGMGCRFPGGADTPEALWQLVSQGRDAIVDPPADRWGVDQPLDAFLDAEGRAVRAQGGFLNRVDLFDPLFFGISPREAETLDPQQRLLLEVAWEALENAGLAPEDIAGSRTGVFLGLAASDFAQRLIDQDPEKLDGYIATGSSHSVAAGRLSYTLHLSGPSLSIDTSCSSSLVAVSAACDSLRLGRSNLALAGGVSLILSPETTMIMARGGMLSPGFRCKTFDASADGFVRGEGCGLIILKRLSDAERDGDRILAVIRGTAVNQDGRSSGLTAPNGLAQQALLREALTDAGLTPTQVQYIEAHGTGTALGDPIELQALAAAFGQGRSAGQPLLVGSIKTNFGHLEAAAGIAGLMKLVLAIQHGQIPPLLHLKTLNPHLDWASMPLAIPTDLTPWPGEPQTRVGGVSSFGVSGTNAHLLLAAPPIPAAAAASTERPLHLLSLSARGPEALRALARRYSDFLRAHPESNSGDLCFTANCGRAHHGHRVAIAGATTEQLGERLREYLDGKPHGSIRTGKTAGAIASETVFLFTGQGSQYAGMGRELYHTQPAFRKTLDRCDAILRGEWNRSLLDVIWNSEKNGLLNQTAFTQPALFAIEYALAELLQSWGIRPAAVMGHSVGEYAAACVAGVLGLEEALKLIATRARLMQALPAGGGMVVVLAGENDVLRAIAPFSRSLSIAAFNGPSNLVVSGPLADLDRFTRALEERNLSFQRLSVSHAFHSALLDPALDAFEQAAEKISYGEPQCVVISNLTRQPATAAELRSGAYWRAHARQPVRFAGGIQALRELGYGTFIEIGPTPVLCGMARRIATQPDCRWLPTLRAGRNDWEQLLETIGDLYVSGERVNWAAFDRGYSRRKISLPTYPFERTRYWPEIAPRKAAVNHDNATPDDFRNWLYELEWRPAPDDAGAEFLATPSRMQEIGAAEADVLYRQLPPADDEAAYRAIDALCRDYIVEALAALGCALRTEERFKTEELRRRLGVAARHGRLFGRLLAILAEDRILRCAGEEWIVADAPQHEPAGLQLESVIARHPQCEPELAVLRSCGSHLAEVLTGRCDPMQLLFPEGSLDLASRLYHETRPVSLYNGLVARCIAEAVHDLPAGRPLRILEIGAGTGGTTARVLPHLPADRASYLFTDVSTQFLDRARRRFVEYPFVGYQLLNLDEPVAAQGLLPGSFDIVIAANVVHATRDIAQSLGQIRELLKPAGMALLLEVVRPQRLGDLTVGLTDGWWAFADTELRPDYALLPEARWIELLRKTGFAETAAVPGDAVGKSGLFANQTLLVSKKEAAVPKHSAAGRWLIWSDKQSVGGAIVERLRKRGEECFVVARGDQFEEIGTGSFRVRPGETADHSRVIENFRGSDPSLCRGAVYLWGMDASLNDSEGSPDARSAVEKACRGALAGVQAILHAGGLGDGSLIFVTGGSPDPAQSALRGLAGVVAAEHPELRCHQIEIGGDVDALVGELLLNRDTVSESISLRAGGRAALRLQRSPARELAYPPLRVHADGTYLITGGLTGLGLETAGLLVRCGARRLVLAGRRAAGPKAREAIEAWTSAGINIASVQADIGDEAGADCIFATVQSLGGPLRGVFHSAGVLDDAALLQQDWARFERVLKPKVQGGWNLHLRTLSASLDFFVLFSSGASLLGAKGQANHATANGFLDGLAQYRATLGLPALSINWGPWRETGSATRREVLENLERSGLNSIDTANGLKALECLLAAGCTQAAVLPINWEKFSAGSELFSDLVSEDRSVASVEENPAATARVWQAKLQAAGTPAEHRAILQQLVGTEAARILGIRSSQAIDPRKPLQELGLDSLMAVQLRNTLAMLAGTDLAATLLFNYPTVDQLVDHLASCIAETGDATPAEPIPEAVAAGVDIDDLSEDELARLLEEQIHLS